MAEAEYLIQQALEEVMKGRTSLVIAHRLSTIRDADKVIALEGGASAQWAITANYVSAPTLILKTPQIASLVYSSRSQAAQWSFIISRHSGTL